MEGDDVYRHHIAVIDDDAALGALYREVLEEEGYLVTLAPISESDPTALDDLAPDLVLLDLCFGDGSDGISLLERLKAAAATVPVPVLVCSAHHALLKSWHDQLVAWDCGILPKPFDLDDLLTAVRTRLVARELGMASVCDEG